MTSAKDSTIRLGALQTPVLAGYDEAGEHLERAAAYGPDRLWLLCEMAFGGFDFPRARQLAEETGEILDKLLAWCRKNRTAVAASFFEERGGHLHNSLYLVSDEHRSPRRILSKLHLFPGLDEAAHVTPGKPDVRPARWRGIVFGGAVCFDLRFPEVFRFQARLGVDVFLVPAQWPAARAAHWEALVTARAIENQAWVLGTNGCGHSVLGELAGSSRLIDPWGEPAFALDGAAGTAEAACAPDARQRAAALFTSRESEQFLVVPKK